MRSKKVTSLFAFAILIAVSVIRLDHLSAQQSVSSHFGAIAPNSGSKVEPRSSVIGGPSKWAAGQGSFGTGVQTGGVWTDGSTFASTRSINHRFPMRAHLCLLPILRRGSITHNRRTSAGARRSALPTTSAGSQASLQEALALGVAPC